MWWAILLLPLVFAQYPSVPIPIDKTINLSDPNDYAKFVINIINLENETYDVFFLSSSIGWDFKFYPESLKIGPNEIKNVTIEIRPLGKPSEYPSILVVFKNKEMKIHNVIFHVEITGVKEKKLIKIGKEEEKIIEPKVVVNLLKKTVYPNEEDYIIFSIKDVRKNYTFEVEISSDALYKKYKYNFRVTNDSVIELPIKISEIVLPGKYNITVKYKYDGKEKEVTLELKVLYKEHNILIRTKNNLIEIKNLDERPIIYEYRKKIDLVEQIFYRYNPKPILVIEDGNKYYVWKIFLFPNETFVIKRELNLELILIYLLVVILLIKLLYVYLTFPNIIIRKEILKKDKEMKIMISITNMGKCKVKGIKVKDYIPSIFKLEEIEFVKPIGKYKKDDTLIVEWLIDELLPGEERVIIYTLKVPEVTGEFVLDPAEAEVQYLKWRITFSSNKLFIKI